MKSEPIRRELIFNPWIVLAVSLSAAVVFAVNRITFICHPIPGAGTLRIISLCCTNPCSIRSIPVRSRRTFRQTQPSSFHRGRIGCCASHGPRSWQRTFRVWTHSFPYLCDPKLENDRCPSDSSVGDGTNCLSEVFCLARFCYFYFRNSTRHTRRVRCVCMGT